RTRRSGGLLRSQSGPLPTPGAASRRNATVSSAVTIVLTSVINAASDISVDVEQESRRAADVELVEREMEAISYSPVLFSFLIARTLNRAQRRYFFQRRSLSEVSIELVAAAVSVYEGFQLHSSIGTVRSADMRVRQRPATIV